MNTTQQRWEEPKVKMENYISLCKNMGYFCYHSKSQFSWYICRLQLTYPVFAVDLPVQMNTAKFEFNGNTGYHLKPWVMNREGASRGVFSPFVQVKLEDIVPAKLKVKVTCLSIRVLQLNLIVLGCTCDRLFRIDGSRHLCNVSVILTSL